MRDLSSRLVLPVRPLADFVPWLEVCVADMDWALCGLKVRLGTFSGGAPLGRRRDLWGIPQVDEKSRGEDGQVHDREHPAGQAAPILSGFRWQTSCSTPSVVTFLM